MCAHSTALLAQPENAYCQTSEGEWMASFKIKTSFTFWKVRQPKKYPGHCAQLLQGLHA